MKKFVFGMAMFSIMLVLGLGLTGCGDSEGGPTGNGGGQTGGTGSGDGKVTISLLAGSGTGNIRLKLSEGTWNTSGSWDATQSSNLSAIMNSLLETYSSGSINRSQCTATVVESNTALNIELRNSSGLLEISGEVHIKATLNPSTFPYTSHGGVSLSEKFQVAGNPVFFVNKTRLCTEVGSSPWTSGSCNISITESQIGFSISSGSYYTYTYNIDTWRSDYVGGNYCVTIDVSNGRKTAGSGTPPSCITGKNSFTFLPATNSISISRVNGGTFSGTNGWQNSFSR
jgi:hypothetical protein